jgi:long-chain acyl-CoA synthetase
MFPSDMRTFRDSIDANRERVFLMEASSGKTFTYGKIYAVAAELSRVLSAQGVSRCDRVGIMLNNSVEYVCCYLACLCMGAVAVPINVLLDKEQIRFILGTARLKILLYEPATKAMFKELLPEAPSMTLLCLSSIASPGNEGENCWSPPWSVPDRESLPLSDEVRFDDLFSMTFTSGTTGNPKGVAHRIRTLLQCAYAFNQAVGFGPRHRFYHILPMGYMAGFLNNLLCPMLAGASVVIDRLFDARMSLRFWQTPLDFGVNTMWLVPSILATLLKTDRGRIGEEYCRASMDFICVGTAPLPVQVKRNFEQRYGAVLLESYGLSETLFVATNSKQSEFFEGFVGQPLEGVTLNIANDPEQSAPRTIEGEVMIRSDYMFAGYLNDETGLIDLVPENTLYDSGDIGLINEQGHLRITDRKKDLIIRSGLNISPRKIEDVLCAHPSVEEAAVIGVPDMQLGEAVIAVVKLRQGARVDMVEPDLRAACRSRLSGALVPARFVFLAEFPRSSTGKVSKKDLRAMLDENKGAGA